MPRHVDAAENATRLFLYNQGYTDQEIADTVCLTKNAIYCWRTKHHLKSNGRKGNSVTDDRRKYYDEGMTDEEIAERCYRLPSAIAQWRRKNGLPKNGKENANAKTSENGTVQ